MASKRRPDAAKHDLRQRFVAEYLIDLNATQAYLRAKGGRVKESTAAVEGFKLLREPNVQAAVTAGKTKQLATADLTAARVLEELRRLAFLDPSTLFDEHGKLRKIHDMPPEARACIAGLEVATANFDKTDGKRDYNEWLHKIKLSNKNQALDLLAKHFKLITEVVEHKDGVDWDKLAARLAAVRPKVKKG